MQALLHDAGQRGLPKLLARTGMPADSLAAVQAALAATAETPFDGRPEDRARRVQRVIERVLRQVDDVGADTLDFLLARLDKPEGQLAAG